jgi:serine/threonine-protein kinase
MILKKNGEPFLISPPDLLHLAGDARLSEEVDTTAQLAIDRYVRLGLIGCGGFGEVYHVQRKTSLGSFDFAMKILSPSVFSNAAKAEQRFRREIESLKRLQHRAIVPILESGVLSDSRPYYIMPLIEGQDFRDATEGKEISTRLEVFLNVIEGVQFAHSIGVLHRDLKPRNIIVRKADNQAMILDFGAAFLLDDFEGDTLTTENIGTLGYIPIEVQNNPRLRTEKHDVYSCGILLYEAFARFLPNPQEYSPLSTIDKSWALLDEVIQSAIAPSGTRLSSITEFRQKIESILRIEKASI